MSVRRFGIFLGYPPTVDMSHEGLGRYLAAFLKGAAGRDDVRFVVVCPSWSRKGLDQLLTVEGVPRAHFDIEQPVKLPWILRVYEAISAYRRRTRKTSRWDRAIEWGREVWRVNERRALQRIAGALSFAAILPLLIIVLLLALVALALSPLFVAGAAVYLLWRGARAVVSWAAAPLAGTSARLQRLLVRPEDDSFVLRLYKYMEEAESRRMLNLIGNMRDVGAWFCPTAFWPAFMQIRAPKLMCVPDVVLRDFAIDFCQLGGDRFLTTFEEVERTIRAARNFTTYSEAVKWETLVDGYAVDASDVTVVRHAANDLSQHIVTSGFHDAEATSRKYCEWLLSRALRKSNNPAYANDFPNLSFKFLFYASQFRPNKNLISLLRAYKHLLRSHRIGHKLILTGKPDSLPAVQQFIHEHCLENDVLCLHGLTIEELAACYRLADLAINPSLSEGGCPFTFAEALSVGTPVVMARIPVTEEVLLDQELRDRSLFDPYDWRDMAERIEWAIGHRAELLAVQSRSYEALAERGWDDVVNDHIAILDRIAVEDKTAVPLRGASA